MPVNSAAPWHLAQFGVFDACCAGLLLLSCLLGCWRGFVFEVLSLTAWGGAFVAAQWGTPVVQQWWPARLLAGNARAQYVLTFLLTFIAVLLLLGLLASAARRGLTVAGLRPFDRILGMGFGLLRAMLLLWAFTLVVWLTPMHQAAWWVQSQAAPWLDGSLRAIAPVLPAQVQQWLPPALRIKYQAPVSAHAAAAATVAATATANLAHFL